MPGRILRPILRPFASTRLRSWRRSRSSCIPRYRELPRFGAATGLRPEEWGALERRHVDRRRRIMRVEQKNVDGRIEPGGKTKNSIREVPLTRVALEALEAIPARLETPLLFAAPEGGPLNLDNFRRREWAPAVEAAGVPTPATPYDMGTRSPRMRWRRA